jgi:hypothetical protein
MDALPRQAINPADSAEAVPQTLLCIVFYIDEAHFRETHNYWMARAVQGTVHGYIPELEATYPIEVQRWPGPVSRPR